MRIEGAVHFAGMRNDHVAGHDRKKSTVQVSWQCG